VGTHIIKLEAEVIRYHRQRDGRREVDADDL
jgi:hypothetical protein